MMFHAPIAGGEGHGSSPISLRALSLGASVQSTTMALMAAHGHIGRMPDCAIFADTGGSVLFCLMVRDRIWSCMRGIRRCEGTLPPYRGDRHAGRVDNQGGQVDNGFRRRDLAVLPDLADRCHGHP
jgi:hypothetical protein